MKNILFLLVTIVFSTLIGAQTLEDVAETKITSLGKLIKKAEKKSIDVLKEKTTIRTAELFLKFAKWDEKHIEENTVSFKLVDSYEQEASKMAEELANFERKDVILMLDEAIADLKSLIDGKTFRKPVQM